MIPGFEGIYLFLPVGPLSIGAVEPDLVYPAIVGEQLGEPVHEQLIITCRITIGSRMTVPWGEINAETDPIRVTRISHLFYNVAMTVLIGRIFYAMLGIPAGPKTKTDVMLGREDNLADTRFFGRSYPLTGVQLYRIEN